MAVSVIRGSRFIINAAVDTSKLSGALQWRIQAIKSSRTLRQICAGSALAVARKAQQKTPAVAQATIDAELGVFTGFGIGKRGQRLTGRRSRLTYAARQNLGRTPWLHTTAPLSALIVNARVNYQSVYNQRTNHRWFLQQSPFKGKSRAAGAAAMTQTTSRMIRGRHSSTHFLQSGWNDPIRNLIPHASYSRSGSFDTARGGQARGLGRSWIDDRGAIVIVGIENSIGTQGSNGERYNQALWRYGHPALQAAVDEETAGTIRHIQQWIDTDNSKCNAMMS